MAEVSLLLAAAAGGGSVAGSVHTVEMEFSLLRCQVGIVRLPGSRLSSWLGVLGCVGRGYSLSEFPRTPSILLRTGCQVGAGRGAALWTRLWELCQRSFGLG